MNDTTTIRTRILLALTATLLAASAAVAQTETILHAFNETTDYGYPSAPLIADAAGNLYSTSSSGGPGGHGGVFELSPPAVLGGAWTESMLFSFDEGPDGGSPLAGLVMDANGALYGDCIWWVGKRSGISTGTASGAGWRMD